MLTDEARYSYSPHHDDRRDRRIWFGDFEGGTTGRVVREILLLRKQGYPYDVIWDSVALSDLLRGSNGFDG
jgi:hypothetical protein